MKLFAFFLLLTLAVQANQPRLEDFFKQYPKVCRENTKTLTLKKDETHFITVLRCTDDRAKEVTSCQLGSKCEDWFFDIYLDQKNQFELLHKTSPVIGDKPTLSVQKDIVSFKHSFRMGSTAKEESKFRFEDKKLKLIGIEYSILFNGQLVQSEEDVYASDFSINVLSEKMIRTDHFQGPKSEKITCGMNKFKNLTIADVIDTSIDNLVCTDLKK